MATGLAPWSIDLASFSMIFQLDFGTIQTVCYIFVLHFTLTFWWLQYLHRVVALTCLTCYQVYCWTCHTDSYWNHTLTEHGNRNRGHFE